MRVLLFDGGCAVCTKVAETIAEESGKFLSVRSLHDPQMKKLLTASIENPLWEPTIIDTTGSEVKQGFRPLGRALPISNDTPSSTLKTNT